MQRVGKTVNKQFDLNHVSGMVRRGKEKEKYFSHWVSLLLYVYKCHSFTSLLQVRKHVYPSGREDQITEEPYLLFKLLTQKSTPALEIMGR